MEKIKTMAVLIHIPGNWESVFILGKEPGHIWGMKRVHFFSFFLSQGFSVPFSPLDIEHGVEEK